MSQAGDRQSRKSPIQLELTIQAIHRPTAELRQLRGPGGPVMTDDQVGYLGMNLQSSQATPTEIHGTASAVLACAAAVSAGQEPEPDRALRVRTVLEMVRTECRICKNTSIC